MIDPINHKSSRRLASPSRFLVARSNPYLASLRYTVHSLYRGRHLIELRKIAQIQIGRGAFVWIAKVSEAVGENVFEPSAVGVGGRDGAVAIVPCGTVHIESGWLCPSGDWLCDGSIEGTEGGIDGWGRGTGYKGATFAESDVKKREAR